MRKRVLELLLLVLAITSSLACKKTEPVMEGKSKVRFVNAYLNSDPQELYQDNSKLTTQAIAYGAYSDYWEVNSGRSVFWSNGAVENKATSAIEAVLYNDNAYTLFYYENKESKPSIVGYINQASAPAAGKFKVRFVNLSVMFNDKSLVVNGPNGAIVGGLNYGDNPFYVELPANSEIKVNVKDNTNVTTLDATKFQADKSYLVWFDTFDGSIVQYHIVPQM